MNEKATELAAKIAAMPEDLQDKFLLLAQGAAVALDTIKAAETEKSA